MSFSAELARDSFMTLWQNYCSQKEEIQRLRVALSGIASCSTCAACRGAAEIALGALPQLAERT